MKWRASACALSAIVLVTILCPTPIAQSLSSTELYKKVAESVLVVEVRNGDNRPISLATAFVVGAHELLTNAHAVEGGKVWIKVGAVAIPCEIERTDSVQDLALLRVDVELTTPPLVFARSDVAPGVRVFAIGNPQGLERTISEGLVAAVREVDGRPLLQMSAPISHGSSGGPVLNDRAEVVGVTVSMLRDAQNINFAVPATVANAFILNKPNENSKPAGIQQALALVGRREAEKFSTDPDSPYQKLTREISSIVLDTLPSEKKSSELWPIFEKVKWGQPDIAIAIANRAIELAPKDGLAYYNAAWAANESALFSADEDKAPKFRRAEQLLGSAIANSSGAPRRHAQLLLGQVQAELDNRRDAAVVTLRQVIGATRDEVAHSAALTLWDVYRKLNRIDDAKEWFHFAEATGDVHAVYYPDYAEMLETGHEYREAGRAFVKAGESVYSYLCDASRTFYKGDDVESAIDLARRCLSSASKATDGIESVGYAHRLLSSFLRNRGVTDQAISEAQQAIAVDASDGLAFGLLAKALQTAERWTEAENAARAGIRLTDGAHQWMHFDLGMALFSEQRWSEARSAFEQAAKMDPTDDSAAHNVALSYARMQYYADAAKWYEETLRRNPRRQDAADIRRRIEAFKQ